MNRKSESTLNGSASFPNFSGMTRPLPVLINRGGGTAARLGDGLRDAVEAAFAAAGREIALELVDGSDMPEALSRHAGAPVIVVGGGDGTLGCAAAALAHSPTALAILPLGTRNHLARQLGVPLDLPGAARLCVSGQRRRIDLGKAGARVFVNNASFGIYARFVRHRDAQDAPKWLSSIPAAWHALRQMRAQHFALRLDGQPSRITSPLLFVGNNEYSMEAGSMGERESLADGRLSLYAVAAQSPLRLAGFAVRALIGLARPDRDFEELTEAREIVIEGSGFIQGAFDGELETLPLPLRLRSMPGALGVVTSRETAEAERKLYAAH